MSNVGELLKAARQRANLTQSELADAVGVTRAAIAQWEGNLTTPSRKHWAGISEALGIDMRFEARTDELPPNKPVTVSMLGGGAEPNLKPLVLPDLGLPNAEAVSVTDNSMAPEFKAGDVVLVDPGRKPVTNDIVIAPPPQHQQPLLRRYVHRGKSKSDLVVFDLVANDPEVPTVTTNEQASKIVGVAVAHIRKL